MVGAGRIICMVLQLIVTAEMRLKNVRQSREQERSFSRVGMGRGDRQERLLMIGPKTAGVALSCAPQLAK